MAQPSFKDFLDYQNGRLYNDKGDKTGQRIDGSARRSQFDTFGSGLSRFHALQNPAVRAFEDSRFPGQSATEIGSYLKDSGARLNSRGMIESDRNLSPREKLMMGMSGTGGGQQSINPFASSSSGSGGGMLGSMARTAGGVLSTMLGGSSGGSQAAAAQAAPTPAQNREFLQSIVDGKRAAADFNSGITRGPEGNTMVGRYGSGFSTFGGPRGPGLVQDDFGRMVPIREETARMNAVQETKGFGDVAQARQAITAGLPLPGGRMPQGAAPGMPGAMPMGTTGPQPLGAADAQRFRTMAMGAPQTATAAPIASGGSMGASAAPAGGAPSGTVASAGGGGGGKIGLGGSSSLGGGSGGGSKKK